MAQHQALDSAESLSHCATSRGHRPMEYRFVSGRDTTYSKTIRAHVLQRHLQERRLRAKTRNRKKDKPGDDDELTLAGQDLEHQKSSRAMERCGMPGRSHLLPDQEVTSDALSLRHQVGPQSLLGQGTSDPFLTLAWRSPTRTENHLIDYCW